MPTQHDNAKRWRPWQFSLRTMLMLMFGAGCFLGGWTAHEWQRQRELEQPESDVLYRDSTAGVDAADDLFGGQPMSGEDLDDLFRDP